MIEKNKEKPAFKKAKNKKLFPDKSETAALKSPNFSSFDPVTGEKVAEKTDDTQNRLANMEASSAAKGTREAPSNIEETIKDVGTGGAIGTIGAAALMPQKTSFKKKGIIATGIGLGAGFLSRRKQKNEYNKQQAARELLAGKKTGRSAQYKTYLEGKYKLKGEK